jgi:hypothetical protein
MTKHIANNLFTYSLRYWPFNRSGGKTTFGVLCAIFEGKCMAGPIVHYSSEKPALSWSKLVFLTKIWQNKI